MTPNTTDTPQSLVYLLSDDLIDASKTITVGRSLGIAVKQFRQPRLFKDALTIQPNLLIFDLQVPGLDLTEFTDLKIRCIGYGSHVDAARLREARQAGFDFVMPRSQYFEEMPRHLSKWVNAADDQ